MCVCVCLCVCVCVLRQNSIVYRKPYTHCSDLLLLYIYISYTYIVDFRWVSLHIYTYAAPQKRLITCNYICKHRTHKFTLKYTHSPGRHCGCPKINYRNTNCLQSVIIVFFIISSCIILYIIVKYNIYIYIYI